MLRQLARLGRPVPGAGERALAIAVYGDAGDRSVAAREAGTEGVACVDDAARALELYCSLWERTGLPWTMRWCEGLLDFVLAMQDDDGRFVNFILDWDGTPNRTGRTSVAGGAFWQARAVLALARASRVVGDPRIEPALRRGWRVILETVDAPADVRALHIAAALALLGGPHDDRLTAVLAAWSEELLACSEGGMLMNSVYERGHPHLWGHVQEHALAGAGVHLGRSELVEAAARSATLVFHAIVDTGFDMPLAQPYDVASCVAVLRRMAELTGDQAHGLRAAAAAGWFDGRNPAGLPVYDRSTGRVADGVDAGRVSTRSGAEANIVGAQTLIDAATAVALALPAAEAVPAAG